MLKPSQRKKFFSKIEDRKIRIYKLNGGREIKLLKPYSLRKRDKFIDLFRGHSRKRIHSFPNDITAEEIEKYVLGYEMILKKEKVMWLREYCSAPMSVCMEADNNCSKCKSNHKKWALERKKEGKKIVKPIKLGGFMEAIEERNALLKQRRLEEKENKERFFKRNYTGKWR